MRRCTNRRCCTSYHGIPFSMPEHKHGASVLDVWHKVATYWQTWQGCYPAMQVPVLKACTAHLPFHIVLQHTVFKCDSYRH